MNIDQKTIILNNNQTGIRTETDKTIKVSVLYDIKYKMKTTKMDGINYIEGKNKDFMLFWDIELVYKIVLNNFFRWFSISYKYYKNIVCHDEKFGKH